MKPFYFIPAVFSVIVLVATGANAQMDSCNIFLKGKYVEVGISPGGSYGSSVAAPSGYHGNVATRGSSYGCDSSLGASAALGFVADPDMDGWAVGTPPYYGDYFLPGYPYEGWEIQIGSDTGLAFNTGGYNGPLTGSNVSFAASGSTVSGTWQGSFDSVTVTQITLLDTATLYFTVKVILTNTSSAPINNIYYLRAMDPDNAVMESGGSGYSTRNKIEYQMPDSLNAVVVSATDATYSAAYLALGTADTNARCYIANSGLTTTTHLQDLYNETGTASAYYFAPGDSLTADVGMGLVIKVPHLAAVDSAADSVERTTAASALHPANSASITYFYAFSKAAVDSALKATAPVTTSQDTTHTSTAGIKNVNTIHDINAYPNPAKNSINITGLNITDQLSLYDMMGRALIQNRAISAPGINSISMNNVPAGAYILVVRDANGNVRTKIPVQKQ